MSAPEPCPRSRCGGTLEQMAAGVDGRGVGTVFLRCDRCYRHVEREIPPVPDDHPTLFGGGGS